MLVRRDYINLDGGEILRKFVGKNGRKLVQREH